MIKKLLIAISMLASSTVFAVPMTFGHWEVDNEATSMSNSGVVDGVGVAFVIFDDASTALVIRPNKEPFGEKIKTDTVVILVEMQRVQMKRVTFQSGAFILTPVTAEGGNFIVKKFWHNQRVDFKINNFNFWLSAQGVQKAWRFMKNNRAI